MKKIAIFSDIHGNLQALRSILMDISLLGIEEKICLGDVLGIGPSSDECLNLIIENNIKLILGNNDIYALYGASIDVDKTIEEIEHHEWISNTLDNKQLEFLKTCSLVYNFDIKNRKFGFQHFFTNNVPEGRYPFKSLKILASSINEALINTGYDYMFIGHQHQAFQIDVLNKHLICVGSSGCTKSNKTHYIILTIDDKGVSIMKRNLIYDRDGLLNQIDQTEYPLKEEFIIKF